MKPFFPFRRGATAWQTVCGAFVALTLLGATLRADPEPGATPQLPETHEETLAAYPWTDAAALLASPEFAAHGQLLDAPADAAGAGISGTVLKITNADDRPLRVALLTIPAPPIKEDFYALNLQVRYADVSGDGFLEMWSAFPPLAAGGAERAFFSRTLGETDTDPMSPLRGTSGWRPVILPFNARGAGAHPARLTVNLVLPGRGTVFLSAPRLAQYHYSIPGTTGGPASFLTSFLPGTLGGWRLAVLAAGLLAVLGAGAWAWRTARRRRAAEWRRMAARDV